MEQTEIRYPHLNRRNSQNALNNFSTFLWIYLKFLKNFDNIFSKLFRRTIDIFTKLH